MKTARFFLQVFLLIFLFSACCTRSTRAHKHSPS